MPAKIITLSQKDQDLLRLALTVAADTPEHLSMFAYPVNFVERVKDLKNRLLV